MSVLNPQWPYPQVYWNKGMIIFWKITQDHFTGNKNIEIEGHLNISDQATTY